jgi:glutamyl-queuosine tRNA(Asp) synthetase
MTSYVGRYAPSPSGDLHLGNALAALVAWARARRAGGVCLLRMEDLDTPRMIDGAAARIEEDLAALGLTFDGPVVVQSRERARYDAALAQLDARGSLYACACSRKDLARVASAPHVGEEGPPYPGTCRHKGLPLRGGPPVAWRFVVDEGTVEVDDRLAGPFSQDVAREVGDFVVRRKDDVIAYQLAVVVDDAYQGVTEVVRGRDLLSSSPRQVLLHRALGAVPPAFAHVPLWVGDDGQRLSKRTGPSPTILRALLRAEPAARVLGRMGRALGVCVEGEEIDAARLTERLDERVLRASRVADAGPLDGPLASPKPPTE